MSGQAVLRVFDKCNSGDAIVTDDSGKYRPPAAYGFVQTVDVGADFL
jgi:hypothetical protein